VSQKFNTDSLLIYQAEDTTALFCQMIAQLSELSESAEPTPFHKLLRALDDRGKLLRVYTQNIDALESKSGLTFGVPKPSSSRLKVKPKDGPSSPMTSQSRQPSPPVEIPRVIPLHGTLETLHCVSCTHAYPLRDHLELLNSGVPPHCPECTALEETRQLIGKRSRGVGKLRPSVVLYNEVHKNGEQVGEAVRKDLVGNSKGKGRKRSGADLLLVVGTSLRVPGTKRIVREFSKAVRSRSNTTIGEGGLPTPAPSPRRTPVSVDEDGPTTSIYLNLDFPVPTREWEGVFDVWIKGDAQTFAQALHAQMDKDARAKEASLERKRKREEAERWKATGNNAKSVDALIRPTNSKKRKIEIPLPPVLPTKKRKIITFSDNIKRVTRLSSSSDDEDDESGYTRPKIYLRIPARPHCTVPPAAPPGKFLVPEVVMQNTPLSLSYMSKRRSIVAPPSPAPSPASLKKHSSRKKKAVRTNFGNRRTTHSLAKTKSAMFTKRKEAAAPLSPEVVRNAQYGLRKRGAGG
jgi:NAD-dependent SIR2 family protein deacetylase